MAMVSFKEKEIMFKALNLNASFSSPRALVIVVDHPWLVLVTTPPFDDLVLL
jgi:hypothetical protein